ncbi:MAG: hypothetical protein ACRDQZ_13095 [Mycobacteriales bacterium]
MTVERLVHVESIEGQEPPLLLLADLREIDPRIELVYFGEYVDLRNETPVPDGCDMAMRAENPAPPRRSGRWRSGSVRPNQERAKRGEAILQFEERRDHPNMRNVLLARLLLQGFSQIEEYVGPDVAGVMLVNPGPDEYETTIVNDLRERDANWRRDQGKEVFEERLVAGSAEERTRVNDIKIRDYLANDGRAHYRRVMRGRTVLASADVSHHRSAGGLILP